MGSFSLWHWLILGALVWVIYSIFRRGGGVELVCKSCGFIGEGRIAARGHLAIELILWLCFLIPGLIYSIWRASTRYSACPSCGGSDLIPAASPIGQKLVEEIEGRLGAAK